MKRIKYTGKTPEYLDGFPKECKRSCKGAIHLMPNAIREISADEYEFIKKSFPKLKLVLVPMDKPTVMKMKAPAVKSGSTSKEVKKTSEKKVSHKKSNKK